MASKSVLRSRPIFAATAPTTYISELGTQSFSHASLNNIPCHNCSALTLVSTLKRAHSSLPLVLVSCGQSPPLLPAVIQPPPLPTQRSSFTPPRGHPPPLLAALPFPTRRYSSTPPAGGQIHPSPWLLVSQMERDEEGRQGATRGTPQPLNIWEFPTYFCCVTQ